MKIGRIMKLMKTRGTAILYQKKTGENDEPAYVGPQWISDGLAFYCLDGLPQIKSEKEFYAAYDVSGKKQESFYFRMEVMPGWMDVQRWTGGSQEAKPVEITVNDLTAFSYGNGNVIFIRSRYLVPFNDEKTGFLEYMVRRVDTGNGAAIPVLTVFDGMYLQAIIPQMRFNNTPENMKLGSALNDFTTELWRQIEQDRRESLEREQAQVSILDVEDGEEV